MIKKIFQLFFVILLAKVILSNQIPQPLKDLLNHKLSYSQLNTKQPLQTKEGWGTEEVEINYGQYDQEAVDYFREIALKSEFSDHIRSKPRRWSTDMKIYVDGYCPEYLLLELHMIVKELNDLIDPIQIRLVANRADANYFIFLGSMTDFHKKYPTTDLQLLKRNLGFFQLYSSGKGEMYIDLVRTEGDELAQMHLLREELTQSLWLCNDSWKYPESIFYQGWTTTTEYSEMDKKLISMLYN
jgi:hypothetical protein